MDRQHLYLDQKGIHGTCPRYKAQGTRAIFSVPPSALRHSCLQRGARDDLRGRGSTQAGREGRRRRRRQRGFRRAGPGGRGRGGKGIRIGTFLKEQQAMASNRGVVYVGPGKVEVRSIDFPKLVDPRGKRCEHGVILKIVSTNICGSDQHMVRGRTTAQPGLVLGHEITGEVIEAGRDVEFIQVGDIVSVPFNIACGRCRNCKEGRTGICLNVNPARPGAAYGYVDMGGWVGGQAEYVMVPYADWNLLKFPDKAEAMAKIKDLTLLSDIFPTGYHGAVTAGVTTGSTVLISGAGPVGLAAAYSAQLLGASVVIVGDLIPERLA